MSDPGIILDLSVEELHDRLFTPSADLPEGLERPGIKGIAANKCPFIAPPAVLKGVDQERIQLDEKLCERNLQTFNKYRAAAADKLTALYAESNFPTSTDPDQMIYGGGFFSYVDKQQLEAIHHLSPEELAKTNFSFQDKRLGEMLFRYRARNYPETLNQEEKETWDAFRSKRIMQGDMGNQMNYEDYLQRISELRKEIGESEGDHQDKLALMDKLEVWPLEIGINP